MAREKAEYREFRELLRGGIGSRTQKAFAEEAGISAEHLSRMLNHQTIFRPSIATLRKLAEHMRYTSLADLMLSCGYVLPPAEDIAVEAEKALERVLSAMHGKTVSVYDITKALRDCWTIGKCYLEEIGNGKCSRDGADNYVFFQSLWSTDYYLAITRFVLLKKGECVSGYGLDSPELRDALRLNVENISYANETVWEGPHTTVYKYTSGRVADMRIVTGGRGTAEERLLAAIFQDDYFSTTRTGFGFYYPKTPEGFASYLFAHAGSFCTDRERSSLYQMVADGLDPDTVFKDYNGDKKDGPSGTGVVVAEILSRESGYDFRYLPTDTKAEEDGTEDACVITEMYTENIQNVQTGLCVAVYSTVLALGIEEFGQCYHREYMKKPAWSMYRTKDYHIEYNCKEQK